ncbi:unnamed protein product [Microthlaspi erraticum]|uniref:FBD domain-containing protein n=1 Tax=Microthlaspi erraticum TaxID=1685480 RepID=A0A6D2IU69_9BRAS|nr:unnamed protein product [Microthlaspi erraticum]
MLLCYGFLKIHDSISESYVIKNLDSIVKLDVSLSFGDEFDEASVSSKRYTIRKFLSGISKVAEMIIHKDSFQTLDDYCSELLNEEILRDSSVPECLISSLESVDIKSNILGFSAEVDLVRFFLENSVILKKLTLRANETVFFNQVMKIPRGSVACQVVLLPVERDDL